MFKGMEDYSNIWLYYGLNSNFNKPNDVNNEQFHTSCADLVSILSTFTDEQGNGINFQQLSIYSTAAEEISFGVSQSDDDYVFWGEVS